MAKTRTGSEVVPLERITQAILVIRGQKVLLDAQLAELYGVPTKALNQAVKRNIKRFPNNFFFRLTPAETAEANRSQFVTGSQKHRDPHYAPSAFTEHGAIMAATVLKSDAAIEMSVYVVSAFIKMREIIISNKEVMAKFDQLEKKLKTHDVAIITILSAIRELMKIPTARNRPIGFTADLDNKS
jgi:ORF6N domain